MHSKSLSLNVAKQRLAVAATRMGCSPKYMHLPSKRDRGAH
jgi:hypothetical protein